jgi:hypothetical protein
MKDDGVYLHHMFLAGSFCFFAGGIPSADLERISQVVESGRASRKRTDIS